jgi:hypothetical protein
MKWQLGEQGQVSIRAGEDILRIEMHRLAEAWYFSMARRSSEISEHHAPPRVAVLASCCPGWQNIVVLAR